MQIFPQLALLSECQLFYNKGKKRQQYLYTMGNAEQAQ